MTDLTRDIAGAIPVVCVLAAIYCAGGLHGLWLGWSHEGRMQRWATKVVAQHQREEEG